VLVRKVPLVGLLSLRHFSTFLVVAVAAPKHFYDALGAFGSKVKKVLDQIHPSP
jgi:hypothetical protein